MYLRKKGLLYEMKKNHLLYLMVLPAVIFFFIFAYIPMPGIYMAFTRFEMQVGIFKSPFIGFDNFKFLVISGDLFRITKNTILYNVAFIGVNSFLEITVAIFISEIPGRLFKKTAQSLMFLPYFVSFVLLGVFTYGIFNYEFGSLNSFLKSIGSSPIDVYGDKGIWKYILVTFNAWKGIGYGSLLYFATIMGIDSELYESSRIDGANILQQIRYITLPMIKPTFILLLLLGLGNVLRGQFDLFYQIIGNNGNLLDSTDIIDTYVFRSLTAGYDYGMGAAAGLYQSVFGFVLILTVNYIIKNINSDYSLF